MVDSSFRKSTRMALMAPINPMHERYISFPDRLFILQLKSFQCLRNIHLITNILKIIRDDLFATGMLKMTDYKKTKRLQ